MERARSSTTGGTSWGRQGGRLTVVVVGAGVGVLVAGTAQAAHADEATCHIGSNYDVNADGVWDPVLLDTDGNGRSDQNVWDFRSSGYGVLWFLDVNEDCWTDQIVEDINGDLVPDQWFVDYDFDGWHDGVQVDVSGDGVPDGVLPPTSEGISITIVPEPLGPPVSAGPFLNDVLTILATAPHPPAGNDIPGGVQIADVIAVGDNATGIFAQ